MDTANQEQGRGRYGAGVPVIMEQGCLKLGHLQNRDTGKISLTQAKLVPNKSKNWRYHGQMAMFDGSAEFSGPFVIHEG